MVLKLYIKLGSPPVQAVMLTARALQLDLELITLDTVEEELGPEYTKKNPQHTIPTLEDGDFVLWDSHAITAYLVTVYGKDDSLYPKEPKLRALVDQRLHFDSSILIPSLKNAVYPVIYKNEISIKDQHKKEIIEGYAFLEAFLEGKEWLGGSTLTIADLCCISTTDCLNEIVPINSKKFPLVTAWLKKCTELPYFEVDDGPRLFGLYIKNRLQ